MGLALNRRHPADSSYEQGSADAGSSCRCTWWRPRVARPLWSRQVHRTPQLLDLPWSTFTINTTGCLLIGVVIAALVDRHHTPSWVRAGLVIGVLGGYTTFSTFAQEGLSLFEEGQSGVALAYTLGSVITGVIAVYAGTHIGRLL